MVEGRSRPRRRTRHTDAVERSAGETVAGPASAGMPAQAADGPPNRERQAEERDIDRGLRGLVGGGPSQVGVVGALRARDAARPSAADLETARANLTIVRRGWTPPD